MNRAKLGLGGAQEGPCRGWVLSKLDCLGGRRTTPPPSSLRLLPRRALEQLATSGTNLGGHDPPCYFLFCIFRFVFIFAVYRDMYLRVGSIILVASLRETEEERRK